MPKRSEVTYAVVLKALGSRSAIAREFGVSRQTVHKWAQGGLPMLRQYQASSVLALRRVKR